jgi:rRNA processing protein Krr1/Pno1
MVLLIGPSNVAAAKAARAQNLMKGASKPLIVNYLEDEQQKRRLRSCLTTSG